MSENGGGMGRKGGAALGIGAIILLLLGGRGLGFGTGLGLGPGSGEGDTSDKAAVTQEESAEETETEAEETVSAVSEAEGAADTDEIRIEVAEDAILVNGETVENTEALREILLRSHTEETVIVLKDSQAIKATYDEVKGLLDELEYDYTEE